MKKRTSFIMTGIVMLFLLVGCGQKKVPQTNTEGEQFSPSPKPSAQLGQDLGKPSAEPTVKAPSSAPLWAQDKMELSPGMEIEGVFDASREIIRLSLKQDGDMIKLFVDGEEKLSVPETCEFRLRDILEEDACLELLVGNPKSFLCYNGEEEDGYQVTAYRLHPGELAEVPLLPSGEDNSFYVEKSAWRENYIHNWYFGTKFNAYIYDSVRKVCVPKGYQMMIEGYLIDKRDTLTFINVDGNLLELPEENVTIDESTGVGIAFAGLWSVMGVAHYNIYRSEDCGKNWSLVMEDFTTAAACINYIYILDKNTIFCCFYPSGIAPGNAAYVTLDGGMSWEYVEHSDKTKKYDFLQSNEEL